MVEPKDWRGVAIQLEGFQKYVEGRLTWLWAFVWLIVSFLVAILGAIGTLHFQISGLRSDVSVVSDRVVRIQDDLKEIRSESKALRAEGRQILASLDRIETRQRGPSLVITRSDAELIRARLGIGDLSGDKTKFNVGDQIPLAETKEFPPQLVEAFPQLKGARYAVDGATNALLLVDATNRIFAIF